MESIEGVESSGPPGRSGTDVHAGRFGKAAGSALVPAALNGEPVSPSPTTVYFDGACPVCRREIAHYRRQRGSASIAWVDASRCDASELGPGLDRSLALRRFYVRNADGTLASGAAAFVALWRCLPAFAGLAAFASSRPALALLEAGYAIFLCIRRSWRPVDLRVGAARARHRANVS